MKKDLDDTVLFQAIKAFILNFSVNHYAVERVAFGYEKPGDKVPIDLYIEHLQLFIYGLPNRNKDIEGVYIDGQERISTEYDYTEYVHDLFVYQMEHVFFDAPKDKRLECIGEDIPLLPRFRQYLFDILPLFAEIIEVKVDYTFFDIIPTDKLERKTEYIKWKNFVTAILLKPLKSGSKINSYVKDFTNAPHYVAKLIEKKGNNFYLKPVEKESYEYIFALFSLMQFMNAENNKLLELKMLEWERRHKSE